MGPVLDKIIGPDVVRAFRAKPDAGAIIQPESAFLGLFLRDFQPLTESFRSSV